MISELTKNPSTGEQSSIPVQAQNPVVTQTTVVAHQAIQANAEAAKKKADLMARLIGMHIAKINWSQNMLPWPIERGILWHACHLLVEVKFNKNIYHKYVKLICRLMKEPFHQENGAFFERFKEAIQEHNPLLLKKESFVNCLSGLKFLASTQEACGKKVSECLPAQINLQGTSHKWDHLKCFNEALLALMENSIDDFLETYDLHSIQRTITQKRKEGFPTAMFQKMVQPTLLAGSRLKKTFTNLRPMLERQLNLAKEQQQKEASDLLLYLMSQIRSNNNSIATQLSTFLKTIVNIAAKGERTDTKKDDKRKQSDKSPIDQAIGQFVSPILDKIQNVQAQENTFDICVEGFKACDLLTEYELKILQTNGAVLDADLFWPIFHDQAFEQPVTLPKRQTAAINGVEEESKLSSEEAESDEESETVEPKKELTVACVRPIDALTQKILSKLKTHIPQKSQQRRFKAALLDSCYHLKCLKAAEELLHMVKPEFLPTLAFRCVRHISVLTEQQLSARLLCSNENFRLQHSQLQLLEALGPNTIFDSRMQPEMHALLTAVDNGTVSQRYPNSMVALYQSQQRELPLTVTWIKNPEKCTYGDLIKLIISAYRCVELLCGEKGKQQHALSEASAKLSLSKNASELRVEAEKRDKFADQILLTQRQTLQLREQAEKLVLKFKSVQATSLNAAKLTAMQEIFDHLTLLKDGLTLWAHADQTKFLFSHGDQIWVNLQILDEQSEALLNMCLSGEKIRGHDLFQYRELREHEAGFTEKNLVKQLNVDIGGHYPHYGASVRKKTPEGIAWRLEAAKLADLGDDLDNLQMVPVKRKQAKQLKSSLLKVVNDFMPILQSKFKSLLEL